MAQYELMVVLDSIVVDEEVPDAVARLERLIADRGGTEATVEVQGRRRLAYPVRKHQDGTVVYSRFEMMPAQVKEIETGVRMDQQISRSMLLRL